jgi:hypothetical protein
MRAMGKMILLFIVAVTFFLSTTSAHAIATLRLANGASIFMIEDGCTTPNGTTCTNADMNPLAGVVGYSGSVGIFTINVSTGITNPAYPGLPEMHLNDVSMNFSGSGTLSIKFSETGYILPTGSAFQTHVGGTTTSTGNLTFQSYIDSTNALFGTGTQIGYFSYTGVPSFSGDTSMSVTPSSPFSITTEASLNHDSSIKTSSFDMHVNVVPEPISSTLFVTGGVLLGIRSFRKMKKA